MIEMASECFLISLDFIVIKVLLHIQVTQDICTSITYQRQNIEKGIYSNVSEYISPTQNLVILWLILILFYIHNLRNIKPNIYKFIFMRNVSYLWESKSLATDAEATRDTAGDESFPWCVGYFP